MCAMILFYFATSELNEEKNTLCMVLEFGETDLSGFFASCAKQREGMDPALIKFYWSEMLKAVNALHSEGGLFTVWPLSNHSTHFNSDREVMLLPWLCSACCPPLIAMLVPGIYLVLDDDWDT